MKSLDRTDFAMVAAAALLVFAIWSRHRAVSGTQQHEVLSLDVSQLINRVRDELLDHSRLLARQQEKPVFQLKTFDLEIQFVAKRATKGTAGIELKAVTAETSTEDMKERSHKVVLRYEPMSATSFSLEPARVDSAPAGSSVQSDTTK